MTQTLTIDWCHKTQYMSFNVASLVCTRSKALEDQKMLYEFDFGKYFIRVIVNPRENGVRDGNFANDVINIYSRGLSLLHYKEIIEYVSVNDVELEDLLEW